MKGKEHRDTIPFMPLFRRNAGKKIRNLFPSVTPPVGWAHLTHIFTKAFSFFHVILTPSKACGRKSTVERSALAPWHPGG